MERIEHGAMGTVELSAAGGNGADELDRVARNRILAAKLGAINAQGRQGPEGAGGVNNTAAKAQRELLVEEELGGEFQELEPEQGSGERMFARLRMLWGERRFLLRVTCAGLALSTLGAFAIPKRYNATTQLMPPDSQGSGSLALIAGLAGGQMGGLGAVAGDLLGMKSTGALFVGVLRSRTVEDRIVERFNLRKVYGAKLAVTAREKLAENTSISEDHKSGIITLSVSDRNPERAAA